MPKSLTAIKPLYKQEVHHFDDLFPTWKAHESQVIRTVHSETKIQILSVKLRKGPHCFQQFHKRSQIYFELSLFEYKKMIFLGFLDLKWSKWDAPQAINEEPFAKLLTCLLMFLYDQPELTIFEIFFLKRVSCNSYCAIWFYIAHYKRTLRPLISFCAI